MPFIAKLMKTDENKVVSFFLLPHQTSEKGAWFLGDTEENEGIGVRTYYYADN